MNDLIRTLESKIIDAHVIHDGKLWLIDHEKMFYPYFLQCSESPMPDNSYVNLLRNPDDAEPGEIVGRCFLFTEGSPKFSVKYRQLKPVGKNYEIRLLKSAHKSVVSMLESDSDGVEFWDNCSSSVYAELYVDGSASRSLHIGAVEFFFAGRMDYSFNYGFNDSVAKLFKLLEESIAG